MDIREKIKADFEDDLSELATLVSARFNAEVKSTLDSWKEKFPRHNFEAEEGHGRMSIYIDPPLFGDNVLSFMNPKDYTGSVRVLIEDAIALVDWYNDLEQKICAWCKRYSTK